MDEKREPRRLRVWPWVGMLVIGTVLIYLPLAGIGSIVWQWIYLPVLDGIDAGKAWAVTLAAVLVVAFFICAWEREKDVWS